MEQQALAGFERHDRGPHTVLAAAPCRVRRVSNSDLMVLRSIGKAVNWVTVETDFPLSWEWECKHDAS
jgi:hypothetical protein